MWARRYAKRTIGLYLYWIKVYLVFIGKQLISPPMMTYIDKSYYGRPDKFYDIYWAGIHALEKVIH